MRNEGTLSKWNEDRGFGFIKPTNGGQEVFVHVSAFPRDSRRPHLGERLTYEIGPGKDGKPQARHVLCPDRPAEKPYRLSTPAKHRDQPGLLARLAPLAIVAALGAYGYNRYTSMTSSPATERHAFSEEPSAAAYHCDGRTHCSQMTSCTEASFFLKHCPGVEMDGDNDGVPCEQQWCN